MIESGSKHPSKEDLAAMDERDSHHPAQHTETNNPDDEHDYGATGLEPRQVQPTQEQLPPVEDEHIGQAPQH